MDSHNNFANMVLKQDATRGLIAAAQVLHSKVFNLVPLQELCMRTIAVNLPKFAAVPQLIDCLPPRLKSDILHNLQVMASYKQSNDSLFYVERAVQVPARGNSSSSLKLKKRESGCSAPNAVIPSSILLRLINSTLTKFDFTLCGISQQLFKSNGLDKQILQLFAENPEGITSIVDQRILRYAGRDIPLPAGSCIIEYLEKLTNLKHLDLPTKFNDVLSNLQMTWRGLVKVAAS
ncbi:uncharacterized protein LOC132201069 isoform X2 [Neocloeon triangulifer]|uniref:uncharacterized protein LOC132201069 isoform X2 n=1 Tax=Neocloeon triangulifer TaxID=2078957 RepID=UPI00286F6F2B|nr:uncharacterized protein LOC132201069 isoform X2 [Neocloeon triangulifer]